MKKAVILLAMLSACAPAPELPEDFDPTFAYFMAQP
ncbi:DNA polymerase III subunit chi [Yoonia sediminilitoris]|uniref:Lipoprotein n=1 Tax=Yoonia sediminilitoris TaxID=1286148 RepID=A0A2T6KCS9_9RHOB|nr:DNA polymerase III subunit chi [Yoonia sediminilitoris]PUB12761.1 hypothetical protein C8N45_10969 [Yoonia sediminilitoris]RCW94240.1 hypothetical protein DFP92_10969 [Yoonia sediminilitoris]